ncbi:hypothetical protein PanWU01x14_063600 [Parasponia andersonii]|uniref:RNase H type-1 domain-containing protein n=1 Tax=Parasponia andersonii TaxID=3476 RepID=A0A2P5DH32_PARAD|nr:hypothetical protein PanWU01x14_063600 [Parasponia andersonii]
MLVADLINEDRCSKEIAVAVWKLKFDDSLRKVSKAESVVRSAKGKVMLVSARGGVVPKDVALAEAMAVCEEVLNAKSADLWPLVVETDCLTVVNLLKKQSLL